MKKLPSKIIKLCKKYRKMGTSHRNIAKKLQISLGSAFKYTKGIRLSKKQHLALKLRNFPRITFHQRRLGGLHSPCKFQPKYTREVSSHKPYIRLFNSWNNAIKRAGFEPNPAPTNLNIVNFRAVWLLVRSAFGGASLAFFHIFRHKINGF
jgi:hypothetical protein